MLHLKIVPDGDELSQGRQGRRLMAQIQVALTADQIAVAVSEYLRNHNMVPQGNYQGMANWVFRLGPNAQVQLAGAQVVIDIVDQAPPTQPAQPSGDQITVAVNVPKLGDDPKDKN